MKESFMTQVWDGKVYALVYWHTEATPLFGMIGK